MPVSVADFAGLGISTSIESGRICRFRGAGVSRKRQNLPVWNHRVFALIAGVRYSGFAIDAEQVGHRAMSPPHRNHMPLGLQGSKRAPHRTLA